MLEPPVAAQFELAAYELLVVLRFEPAAVAVYEPLVALQFELALVAVYEPLVALQFELAQPVVYGLLVVLPFELAQPVAYGLRVVLPFVRVALAAYEPRVALPFELVALAAYEPRVALPFELAQAVAYGPPVALPFELALAAVYGLRDVPRLGPVEAAVFSLLECLAFLHVHSGLAADPDADSAGHARAPPELEHLLVAESPAEAFALQQPLRGAAPGLYRPWVAGGPLPIPADARGSPPRIAHGWSQLAAYAEPAPEPVRFAVRAAPRVPPLSAGR